MGRILYLTDEEVSKLEAYVLGESAPTMDFELESDYVNGWDDGRASVNKWIRKRLEDELDYDFLGQALKLSIETEQALASPNKHTMNKEAIRLHVELDRLLNEMPSEEAEAHKVAKDACDKILYVVFQLDPHSKKGYKPKHVKVEKV